MDTANDLHNTVAVARCDLEAILAHCRRTWPKGERGDHEDAVDRAHYALGQPVKDAAAGHDHKSTAAAPDYQSGQSVGSASFELQRNLYADKVDARQTDSATLPADAGLFRKRYRALTDDEKRVHDALKSQADVLASIFAMIAPGCGRRFNLQLPPADLLNTYLGLSAPDREADVTLALRHLEDAVYRAVKALTA